MIPTNTLAGYEDGSWVPTLVVNVTDFSAGAAVNVDFTYFV